VIAPLAAIAVWPMSAWGAIALLAFSHFLVLYPTLRPNVQWLGPVITRFETNERELWLTIDDGPTEDTAAVLDLFARKHVAATFFVKGELVEKAPALVQQMLDAGHSVANHSQTHPSGSFWCLPPRAIEAQVDACNVALERASGQLPRWFRAPVGMKNPFVHPVLTRRGMRLIGWTVRGFDAVISDPDEISRRITPLLEPGGIIVLHQGRSHSLKVLERVIDEAQQRGYRFVVPEDGRLKTKR
jgi:peptidoglycan/xylan/chitin deacetylase (PgdA/CDA1 family)